LVYRGLAIECAPKDKLDETFDALLQRIALMPINQLVMQKQLCNLPVQQAGLAAQQMLSVYFDGISRHTKEGYAFQQLAAMEGFKAAVAARDGPFDRLQGAGPQLGPQRPKSKL